MVVGVGANAFSALSLVLEWLDAADFPPLRVTGLVWLIGTVSLAVVIVTYVFEVAQLRRRP
jgi:hypothetical protein